MIRLALFKVQLHDSHKFDNIIYGFQKLCKDPNPEYVHVELDFGVDMFSSSGRRKNSGVRFVTTKGLDLHKWDFFDLKIAPKLEKAVRQQCHFYTGLKYDYLAILGMALPGCLQLGTHWYCSEICNHVLAECGIVEVNKKIRPSQMLESYRKQGII
jgi:hypothetical protein